MYKVFATFTLTLAMLSGVMATDSQGATTPDRPTAVDTEAATNAEVLIEHTSIPGHDGTPLEAWIARPAAATGPMPIVLHSSPYLGACYPDDPTRCRPLPTDEVWFSEDLPPNAYPFTQMGVAPIRLIREGYALAYVSVRGTAGSGGCLDLFGEDEQKDQVAIVNHLRDQAWSTGSIGMVGVSYSAGTAMEAAVRAPDGLKAVVISGLVTNLYEMLATPQGAAGTIGQDYIKISGLAGGPVRSLGQDDQVGRTPDQARLIAWREANCTRHLETLALHARNDRGSSYFNERNLLDDLDQVEAAMLLAHGFQDSDTGLAHMTQENPVWGQLPPHVPARMLEGQWNHCFPQPGLPLCHPGGNINFDSSWEEQTWEEILIGWLDHYVKGTGPAPRSNVVDFQDDTGQWHSAKEWPVKHSEQALFFGGEKLAPLVDPGSRTFRSAPNPMNSWDGGKNVLARQNGIESPFHPYAALCGEPVTSSAGNAGLAYISDPLTEDSVIAGNPVAHLRISSDLPGGLVTIKLLDLAPDWKCGSALEGEPGERPYHPISGVRVVTQGAADLRFNEGNFVARPFPVGVPTDVRIDLNDIAMTIPAGHMLAATISYGETHSEYSSHGFYPQVTVHEGPDASQLVLPVIEGDLGGVKPKGNYLPRPFLGS